MIKKDYYAAVEDYNHAVISGIVKIAAKMGISTIQSYQGSQIFEAIGISADVIDKYFTGTVSRVGGITLEDIAKDVDERHSQAFDPLELSTDLTLDSIGRHKSRSQGEEHRYNPRTIHTLQESTRRGDYKMFKEYTAMVDSEESGYLRSLMDFDYPEQGVPLEEVESVDSIVKRFKTGAMSYGSISQEAHETLAIAMNRLHGKSNTGEGGESDDRLESPERCSAIKQVASGRFGVTSKYLVSAKAGEGGHLPAGKVYPWIAKTRHSTPGVSLISPPPHHDIYSIEDLAQLIYDLKNSNVNARISVKLVSEAGVGTVAAGVAKAGAQVILISGYDGEWSVYVKDLESNEDFVLNDKPLYSASLIKAFVMAKTYQDMDDVLKNEAAQMKTTVDNTKVQDKVNTLLWNMITVSDNESCNELGRLQSDTYDFIDGAKQVNKYLKKEGYTKTSYQSTLHPSASKLITLGGHNQTTVTDCGKLLERIYRGECVSKEASEEMLDLLKKQQNTSKIPEGLGVDVPTANKTGETDEDQHDIAIVYGTKTTYILCVMSENASNAIANIRNISRVVYNYLNL